MSAVLLGRRRHPLVGVEEMQVARGVAGLHEGAHRGLHAATAPDPALHDVTRDVVLDDVAHGEDQGVQLLRRGHRPRLHGADGGLRRVVVVAGEVQPRGGRLGRRRGGGRRSSSPGRGYGLAAGRLPELVAGEAGEPAVDGVSPSHGAKRTSPSTLSGGADGGHCVRARRPVDPRDRALCTGWDEVCRGATAYLGGHLPEGLPSVPAGGDSIGVSLRSNVNSALARAVSHLTELPALVW